MNERIKTIMKTTQALAGILLMVICTNTLSAGSSGFCSIGKGLYYDQAVGGAPVIRQYRSHLLTAQLIQVTNVSWAKVWLPPSFRGLRYLQPLGRGGPFAFWDGAPDQTILDTLYPNGDWSFDIYFSPTGHQYFTNTLVAGSFPNPPTVANLGAAQTVDAASDFILSWNAFDGATVADFISCQVQTVGSNVFSTPAAGTPGALPGTATSVVLPAGTFRPGHAYLGRLVFYETQQIVTNAQWGASGGAFLFTQTDFWLKTQGEGDSTPPMIAWTSPTNGASGVPQNSPLGVHFTKPMLGTGGNILQTGFDVGIGTCAIGAFAASPSPDGLELVLTPLSPNLCAVSTFFNYLGFPLSFGDANGNPLAQDTFVVTLNYVGTNMIPSRTLLTNPLVGTDGIFEVDLQGQPDYSYILVGSSDLATWSSVQTNVAFSGAAHYVVTNSDLLGTRAVYRAVAH
jgi:hypothetical protein